jgi:hypothetical protein
MTYFRYGVMRPGLLVVLVLASMGCDTNQSTSEVHRTADFQKAAMDAKKGMQQQYVAPQKTQKKGHDKH